MAKLKIKDIKPTGAELFDDSESFMSELSNDELEQAIGGLVLSPKPIGPRSCFCPPTYTPMTTVPPILTKPTSPVIL